MLRSRRHGRRQRGAVLVEMALIAPIFFLLVFAVIEFGWAFVQYLDVRHGARETARLAAVNYSDGAVGMDQALEIIDEGCSRMDTVGDAGATVNLDLVGSGDIGDEIRVEVTTKLETLTGFLDFALGDIDLESEVVIRVEDQATWLDNGDECPP